MNEEKKEETPVVTEEKTEETPEEKTEETTEETPEEATDIDYKAELEAERKRRVKAEAIIQRNKGKDDDDDYQAPEVDIDELVNKKVEEKLSGMERRLTQGQIDSLVAAASTNPDEVELIKYHLENTIRPSGDLKSDVDRAKMLANGKR